MRRFWLVLAVVGVALLVALAILFSSGVADRMPGKVATLEQGAAGGGAGKAATGGVKAPDKVENPEQSAEKGAQVSRSATPGSSPLSNGTTGKSTIEKTASLPALPQGRVDRATGPAGTALAPPSFDVVRISRDCTAVVAGRATPGSKVTVWDGERPLGQVVADGNGEWVLVVAQPLRSGSRELSLIAELAGSGPVTSASVVVVAVPDCAVPLERRQDQAAIAVLTPREGGGSTVLQAPPAASGGGAGGTKALTLGAVDYDENGQIVLSGKAEPGTTVQAYVDNVLVGAATADPQGDWRITPTKPVDAGIHKLRIDQLGPQGKVAARIELPFSRAHPSEVALAPGHVVVQPGNSLWRIARRTYGHGTRYAVIYQANQGQIRDPDLIYPGQVFALPANPD